MINLNTYISEKLHINKDTKLDTFAGTLCDILCPEKYYDECFEIFDDFAKEHDINSLDDVDIFAEENTKKTLNKIFKKTLLKNKIEYKDHNNLVPYYAEAQHTEYKKFEKDKIIIYVNDDIMIFFDLAVSGMHLTFQVNIS